jgi:diaminohydroxyphosphoribosylaminopyrimidine deaminase/5-amino-6-(5-phosphoribosylamino)uracil reductase
MTKDEKYIRRCIQLARNGMCNAAPNPMVGAVIVCNDRIIGEGYHVRCGEGHAEVNAIRSVKDESLLKKSTIYVSLEPCSHYGKTPPCADLIIEKGIPKVLIRCTLWFIKFNEEDSNRESVFILYLIIKNKLTPNLKERGWNGYL